MTYRYDSYCGIYCGACLPLQIAKRRDAAARAQGRPLGELGEKECRGCKTDFVAKEWCLDCHFKKCCKDRGIEFCHECPDYPCDRYLESYNNHSSLAYHRLAPVNLGRIQEAGLAAWLEAESARWRCPACNTEVSFFDKACGKCRTAVKDHNDQEKELGQRPAQPGT